MTEWRIKEISDLTNISIRMLRHYDKMGLLKPSYRSSNGYRCYTEQDLAKLQQVIALKYFGFKLGTIKNILQKHPNIYAHLQAQQQVLKEQSVHLQQVTNVLGDILNRLSPSETPNWNDLITLIERYRMTNNLRDKLKKTWAGKELSESQFEEYLFIYEHFPEECAALDKIIEQINNKELGVPESPQAQEAVFLIHDVSKKMKKLFTEQMKFSSDLLASIQSGKLSKLQITPEGAVWLSKATLFYWLKRWNTLYEAILENLKSDPEGKTGKKIAGEWTRLVDEYFSIGSRSFLTGVMLWAELARQDNEMKALKTTPSIQEMLKELHIPLFFNPKAVSWINRALAAHTP